MKLFELIDKANNNGYAWEPTSLQIEETLIRECADYLREVGRVDEHFQMWRGSHDHEKKFQRVEVREDDRFPLDTPDNIHSFLNKWFEKKVGWKSRNGVFCSGHVGAAGYFGNPYAVFPIRKFSYVWSPNLSDLAVLAHLWDDDDEDEDEVIDEAFWDQTMEHRGPWKTDELEKAVKSGNEIMVNCKAYFMLDKSMVSDIDWDYIYEAI